MSLGSSNFTPFLTSNSSCCINTQLCHPFSTMATWFSFLSHMQVWPSTGWTLLKGDCLQIQQPSWQPPPGPGLKHYTSLHHLGLWQELTRLQTSKSRQCLHQSSAPGPPHHRPTVLLQSVLVLSWITGSGNDPQSHQPGALWQCCGLDSSWWAAKISININRLFHVWKTLWHRATLLSFGMRCA